MSNFFRKQLESSSRERQKHFSLMFAFGERMRGAMGLTSQGLAKADREGGILWHIPGFVLSVRAFPQNGWIPTIIASPGNMDGNSIGYSNTPESPPNDWYYEPRGTATVFYPPFAIQGEILERIKNTL